MALPVLKVLLAAINIAVLFLVVALLITNRKSQRHNFRSWATAFQVIVLGWLILRGIFWVSTITAGDKWDADVFYLLYWLPNPLQFGSFLVLPLFYSQVLSSKRDWRSKSRMLAPVYVSLVGGMVVLMVVGALWKAVEERKDFGCVSAAPYSRHPRIHCYNMEFTNEAFRVLTAVCFFALAGVVATFGLKMSKLTTSQNRLYFIDHPRALAGLNCFLFLVFLSKGAYQISAVMNLWYLPDLPLKGTEDVCILNFFVFLVWDYAPTLWLLLAMMTRTGRGQVGGQAESAVVKAAFPPRMTCVGDVRNLPDYGLFREIKAAAFAAEEAAKMEAQSRSECRSLEAGLQYSPSPRGSFSTSPMANSWFREGDNNPQGTKISPFGSSFDSSLGGSSFGGSSIHSAAGVACPGSMTSSTESSLGGVGFVVSPCARSEPTRDVGLWSRLPSFQQQQQQQQRDLEGVGGKWGGGGVAGGGFGAEAQQQQQQHLSHRYQHQNIRYQQQIHPQSSPQKAGGIGIGINGSGSDVVYGKQSVIGIGRTGMADRDGLDGGVQGGGGKAALENLWTKLVGRREESKQKMRGPRIPVRHGQAATSGNSNEVSRLLGNSVKAGSLSSSPPAGFGGAEAVYSIRGYGAGHGSEASTSSLPWHAEGRRGQADTVGRGALDRGNCCRGGGDVSAEMRGKLPPVSVPTPPTEASPPQCAAPRHGDPPMNVAGSQRQRKASPPSPLSSSVVVWQQQQQRQQWQQRQQQQRQQQRVTTRAGSR